jgi:hypothetical protein
MLQTPNVALGVGSLQYDADRTPTVISSSMRYGILKQDWLKRVQEAPLKQSIEMTWSHLESLSRPCQNSGVLQRRSRSK